MPAAAGRSLQPQRRQLADTQTKAATVLVGAAILALTWANLDEASYEAVWQTALSIDLGGAGIDLDLRHWVNSGLMTLYFFVFGLEARRELDLGELRERRRFVLPLLAGLGGMTAAVVIYLAFNGGKSSAYGWGIAMSTDTAFALGLLALVGPRFPDRVRTFLLTIVVVDDVVALVVIATAYTQHIAAEALLFAIALFGVVIVMRTTGIRRGPAYAALGIAIWVALLASGVEPVVVGLAMGLVTYAHPVGRSALERATDRVRQFREQPTPALAHSAREGLRTAISPNDRLQELYHPLVSYAIVPLFAFANVGIVFDRDLIGRGVTSPITLGIIAGYLVGKPFGIVVISRSVTLVSRGRLRPPVGWAAVAGVGTLAGIGFTVSLLVATLAFDGMQLEEAKLGILTAAVGASASTWLLFRTTNLLPQTLRARALVGSDEPVGDLQIEVDPHRDHVRGPGNASVTIVEYGDFECPHCGQAERIVRVLLHEFGGLRYVWRHLPLVDIHPNAQLAAEAAEAAAAQGQFWPMHDLLLRNQHALGPSDALRYAEQLHLDVDRFADDLRRHTHEARVAEDVQGADQSGVFGTPTLFINGRRYYGRYDIGALSRTVSAAAERAAATRPRPEVSTPLGAEAR
jgi:Na+/H+ antiporter NhaA